MSNKKLQENKMKTQEYENLMRNVRRLQRVYDKAITRENYDLALRVTNRIDQLFYQKGIDLVKFYREEVK